MAHHLSPAVVCCTLALLCGMCRVQSLHHIFIQHMQTNHFAGYVAAQSTAPCSGAKAPCQWATEWAFNGTRWNGTQLPYIQPASGPPTTLSACCAACRSTTGCVFFDTSPSQGCRLFDMSVFYNADGRIADPASTASFIDAADAAGYAWQVAPSQSLQGVPGDTLSGTGQQGCAASCADACGCALYQVWTVC